MIIGERDGLVVQIIRFTQEHVGIAESFAERVINDKNFTHFTHTRPGRMLGDDWEVYLLMFGEEVIGWGQVQKFPRNLRKSHIARLGFIVAPEYRGKGYGGIILDYLIEKTSGYKKLTANVFRDNCVSLTTFLKRGFTIEGCFQKEELDSVLRDVVALAKF